MTSSVKTPVYVTEHKNGFQVRLPKRLGGKSKFFTIPTGSGAMAAKQRTLQAATRWRDKQFDAAGMAVNARVHNNPNAGVFPIRDSKSQQNFIVAVWMYQRKQVKRSFSVKAHGAYLAYVLAHMARDIGVRLEAESYESEIRFLKQTGRRVNEDT